MRGEYLRGYAVLVDNAECGTFENVVVYARLAQLVERVIDVDDVRGSNPLSRT